MEETFLHQNIVIFYKIIKSQGMTKLVTFFYFAYFSNYLQTKKTPWKQENAII